jgi:hypothetical protein
LKTSAGGTRRAAVSTVEGNEEELWLDGWGALISAEIAIVWRETTGAGDTEREREAEWCAAQKRRDE